jgi:hypothetical protein
MICSPFFLCDAKVRRISRLWAYVCQSIFKLRGIEVIFLAFILDCSAADS